MPLISLTKARWSAWPLICSAFWKALFPEATVVGVDIKLKRWLKDEPPADGVVYLEADQTDTAALEQIAVKHGPFDVAIDDGSHVSEHQAITLRSCFRARLS